MSEVVLSELAETDLTDIWIFVAEDNTKAADRLLDQIYNKCHLLAGSPKAGRPRPELDPSVRSFAVDNYVIFYRETGEASRSLACCTAVATSRLFSDSSRCHSCSRCSRHQAPAPFAGAGPREIFRDFE